MLKGFPKYSAGVAFVALCGLSHDAAAQGEADAQVPVYKLDARARIVLEDVTVTDAKGNPVTGLAQSAFHVRDDGKSQTILNFSESTGAGGAVAPDSTRPGTFGNAAINHSEGTVAVLLVDPIGMELPDQLDLRLQMLRYIKTMPPGVQAIVFRAGSRGTPVLIQSLTSDHGLLADAVTHCVPVLPRPVTGVYSNAVSELRNMAIYLRTIPGKKALLWFAGSFPLYVQPDYGEAALDESAQAQDTREAYRALEAARAAVYPIDVRGVLNANIALNQASDTVAAANDPSTTTKAAASDAQNTGASYTSMDKLAAATGGRAYYSQNLVWKAIGSAIDTADHAYSLAYTPTAYTEDGRWHKVSITVDGGYQIHYRNGYYAAETKAATQEPAGKRKRLKDGEVPQEEEGIREKAAASTELPLTFSARVQPANGQRGRTTYEITYAVPTCWHRNQRKFLRCLL